MKIVLENRWAYVTKASRDEDAFLRDYYAFFFPAARYDRRYKLYLSARYKAEAEGIKNPDLPGWDGMIRLYKDGRIPAGLFRATREHMEKECGTPVHVRERLPEVEYRFRLEATEPDGKYMFQAKCVKAMHKATPHGGGIVLVATGGGKTKMASDYFSGLTCTCLFVVDTIDLLHQSAKEIAEWLGEAVGVVGEGSYYTERVTVATSQTLHSHLKDRKFRRWYEQVQIVVVDELHTQMGRRNFDVLEKIEPVAVFGLTATLQLTRKPVRFKAWSFCGPVIFSFPIATATKKKVVTKGGVLQLLFPHDAAQEYEKGRQGYQEEYDHEIVWHRVKTRSCRKISGFLLKAGKYILVLADRIKHVDKLADKLPLPNRKIRGNIVRTSREESRREFEAGDVRLIIASTRTTQKGVNLRRLDAMINMAEGGSKDDALQAFGRSVRLHRDKDYVYYVDIGTDGGRFGKRAFRRRKAFRDAGIPLKMVKVSTSSAAVKAVKKWMT